MSEPKPTVYDQIRALWGVRDALLNLAEIESEKFVPNHEFLLEYLARSIDIATDALYSTLCDSGSRLDLKNLPTVGFATTHNDLGFHEPYGTTPAPDNDAKPS